MKKRLLYNTIFSLLLQICTIICGMILPRLFLVHYGSEVNGLIHSITQFLGVISFLELGVGQVIQSALYRPLADKDNDSISKIYASGNRYFRIIAGILAVYIVVLMCVYPFVAQHDFGWFYIATLVATLSINSMAQYCFGIVDRILLNADQYCYIQCAVQIAVLLCNTVISILMIRLEAPIQAVKLIASLITLMSPVIIHLYIRRHYRIDRKITYTEEPVKQKMNGIAQHISYVVLDGTDTIVLTMLSTLSSVSVYSVYHMVIYGMMQLYRAAINGFHAIVGNLWAKREIERLNQVFGCIETLLHYAVVFLFSCTAVLLLPFIRIYTDGITDADYIQPVFAALLIFAHSFQCLRSVYNMLILGAGHYKETQSCHIIAAVMNLTISVITVKYCGLIGVAIGTLAALAYQTIWMAVYDSNHILKWPLKNFVKHIIVDLLTAGVIVIIASGICRNVNGYSDWFIMSLMTAVIAMLTIGISAVVFYRKQFGDLRRLLKKI